MPEMTTRALRPADTHLLPDTDVGQAPIFSFRRDADPCGDGWAWCLREVRDALPQGCPAVEQIDRLLADPIAADCRLSAADTLLEMLGTSGTAASRSVRAVYQLHAHATGRCSCAEQTAASALRSADLLPTERFGFDWAVVVRPGSQRPDRPEIAFLDIAEKINIRDVLISKRLCSPDRLDELDVFEGPDVFHYRLAGAGEVEQFSVWRLPSHLDRLIVEALSFYFGYWEQFLPQLLKLTPTQAAIASRIKVPDRGHAHPVADDSLAGDPATALNDLLRICSTTDPATVALAAKLAGTWTGSPIELLDTARDLT